MADINQEHGGVPTPPKKRTGGPATPRGAAGGASSAAPQDTMQFIALANKSREQAASAGAASGSAGPQGSAGSAGAGPAHGAPAGASFSDAAFAEDIPRIDTEFGADAAENARSQTAFQGAPADDRAEFYDFHLPYGEDRAPSTEDGLVKHRHSRRDRRRRRIRNAVVAVVVVLVVAVGASGALLMRSAMSVRDRAQTALSLATSVRTKVTSGDFTALPEDAGQLDSLCADIAGEVNGPLWQVASFLPVVGGDVSAARTLVNALADVSSEALVPMASELAQATPGKLFSDGTINVSALQALVDSLVSKREVFDRANEQVQSIGDTHIGQVTELVDTARDGFSMLSGAVDMSEKLSPVLPAMLGANGSRNYLIVAENNAEIRAIGGFGGASGVLTIENGAISLGDFEGTQTLAATGPTDRITITDEEMALFQPYEPTLNYTAGDSFFTPDFPRGAQLASTIWSINHDGQRIDGVFAVDPTFLQYVLQLTGGVTAVDGTEVDGTNAAKVLLSDVYWNYPTDGAMQDAVFASVADAAFDKLVAGIGDLDLTQLFSVVGRGVSEQRLVIWMRDDAEEAVIDDLDVDGALPTTASDPQTGVFVNNYSYSKLDWYLNLDVQASSGVQSADGTVAHSMTVTLTNTLSQEEAQNLPAYVQAHNGALQSAEELLRLYLYAPMGGSISDIECSAGPLAEGSHNGLQVFYGDIHLLPGESVTVTYMVTVPAEGAGDDLEVRVTPTAQAAREGTAAQPAQ